MLFVIKTRAAQHRRLFFMPVLLVLFGFFGCMPAPIDAQGPAAITITPVDIPLSDAEIVNPTRGYYRWYGDEAVPQPHPAYDHYTRYDWRQLEPTRGQYDFSAIEQALQTAQQAQARFAFRVMSVNEFTSSVTIPDYLKDEAGGSYCKYGGVRVWVPDWNNAAFIARALALVKALGAHFDGDPRLGYYDMGIYGHWGEWHNGGLCTPPASTATKRKFIDMQIAAFPHTRILMNSGANEVDAFLYALSRSLRVGIRVDSLCDPWFDAQFTQSPEKLAAVQERWKTAPIVAEFYSTNPKNIAECDAQVRNWHISAISNSRLTWNNYSSSEKNALVMMGKHAGYRIVLNDVTYSSTVRSNAMLTISSNWSNTGVAPVYEPFTVIYELRPRRQNQVIWSAVSYLDVQELLPSTTPRTVTDSFFLSSNIPPGVYTLSVIVKDLTGYRAPLALAIEGADDTGGYELGNITIRAGARSYNVFLPLG